MNLWDEIKARADNSKAPALIYHDLNLVERILRDQVTGNFSHIWVDTEADTSAWCASSAASSHRWCGA